MKAILVIDMPKDCWDCHLVDEWGNCNAIKMTSERYGVSVKQNDKERPTWCPLRPLPDRENPARLKDGTYFKAYDTGWNDCLNAITGDTGCTTQKKDISM